MSRPRSTDVSLYWGLLRDVIAQTRRNRLYLFENFEWPAARAGRCIEAHPHGNYPAKERRMLDDEQ